jgi:hypothetical protein
MNTPKLLPWHARKAGIPTERAEALWRQAVLEATAETGWVGTPEYWGATTDHFLRLLEAEKALQVTPLVRSHNRLLGLPLQALEDLICGLQAGRTRAAS